KQGMTVPELWQWALAAVCSPHDALPEQDRLAQPRGHHLVAIDEWQEKPKVLLRAAEVVAERGPPLVAEDLEGVLRMLFLQRFLDRVGCEQRGPATRIDVLGAGGVKPTGRADQQGAV